MVELVTPSKPISREEFTSLREKVAKDSPKLYKNKILSGPDEQLNIRKAKAKLPPKPVGTPSQSSQTGTTTSNEIGSFENPVLRTLAERTVNREWETQRLIANIIAWSIWDLLSKFCSTLAKHSKIGKELVSWINRELVQRQNNNDNRIISFLQKCYHRYPSIWNKLNWSNINFMFHLVVIINVLFSLWRLSSKVKTEDLHLNETQRQLLGVGDQSKDSAHTEMHRKSAKEPSSELVSSKESNTTPPEPPNTPFLFKSLETPMRLKQKQEAVADVTQSAVVNRVNAFGLSQSSFNNNKIRSNTRNFSKPDTGLFPTSLMSTPVSKTGYIPSSKYTYMMNSPTPRKKT